MATATAFVGFEDIVEYESHLEGVMVDWKPLQRVAFAAAMVERWLPVYERFSSRENRGDAKGLRRILDSVWAHAQGTYLSDSAIRQAEHQIDEVTPHYDDFDELPAMAVCVMLKETLDTCKSPDNESSTVRPALSGFEAAVPGSISEDEEMPRLWKKTGILKELTKQLQLVELISALTEISKTSVATLIQTLKKQGLIEDKVSKQKAPKKPAGMSNQEAFGYYRKFVENHLKSPPWLVSPDQETFFASSIFAQWGCRYLHRMRTINGKNGVLADDIGQKALISKLLAEDLVELILPPWSKDLTELLALCIGNPLGEYDAKTLMQPHAFGPSMRRIWWEAHRQGHDAWKAVLDWARARPTIWADEDQRKKRGQMHTNPQIAEACGREISWERVDDYNRPWQASVDGKAWQIQLNNFPDDLLYSLIVDGVEIGKFHDWPTSWTRV